jgi:hypothetical protein
MRPDHRVEGELDEDRGLHVRVGDAPDTRGDGLLDDLVGRDVAAVRDQAFAMGLGDLPVLAEGAVEVAALGRDRVGVARRQEMEERLLLDRLGAGDDQLPINEGVEPAAAVLADAADSRPGPRSSTRRPAGGSSPGKWARIGAGTSADSSISTAGALVKVSRSPGDW